MITGASSIQITLLVPKSYYVSFSTRIAYIKWTLLGTREPTHKKVIFCQMNLNLDELC